MAEHSGNRAERLSRRQLIERGGVGIGGIVLSGAVAQPLWARPRAHDADTTIKIGFVSPITGADAGFGEPDPYVLSLARKAFAKGLTIGGTHYTVQVLNRDSQSAPPHAAQVANDLIHGQNVDLILSTSTPETVNPVSDACEAAAVPYITTVVRGRRGISAAARRIRRSRRSSTASTSASAPATSRTRTRICGIR